MKLLCQFIFLLFKFFCYLNICWLNCCLIFCCFQFCFEICQSGPKRLLLTYNPTRVWDKQISHIPANLDMFLCLPVWKGKTLVFLFYLNFSDHSEHLFKCSYIYYANIWFLKSFVAINLICVIYVLARSDGYHNAGWSQNWRVEHCFIVSQVLEWTLTQTTEFILLLLFIN